jgi:hypothetical protein
MYSLFEIHGWDIQMNSFIFGGQMAVETVPASFDLMYVRRDIGIKHYGAKIKFIIFTASPSNTWQSDSEVTR